MTPFPATAWLPSDQEHWTTAELEHLGIGRSARRRLLTTGDIVRLRPGLFARRRAAPAPGMRDLADQTLHAHVHRSAARPDAAYVYSHTSAARLRGLRFLRDSSTIHVSCTSNPCTRRLGAGVRTHIVHLPEDHVENIAGIRCTTLERTIIDCARIMPLEDAVILADQALGLGADLALLLRMLEGMTGYRGVVNARRVVELADPRSESVAESRARLLFHLEGLPNPIPQWEVQTPIGRRFLDFAWPEKMLAAEFDGEVKYFGSTPTDRALYEERLRERHLMELGWRFVRLTWSDLERPGEVRRRITSALRGPAPPPRT
ncbi:type IV toxin-antitoxin system AbiEi family antitoxin domain-containing protein [Arthrobacter sp. Y-9]|uniref:type IV toxin-antitoxin system AbiEi family antitoxin domain-containing protein n=1 Tax=Arthrobacter sp. Y-9 TaxID=3039385 RepID=UPI00241D9727|nr:type IV toxin-antitoxin system AbiEi family antitoxin domain-containing protein [Arthrobacter sp. Y-9]WFR84747.1 hypothetical protein P9849_03660 [Arthrobacter sp. Y-9]